MYEVIHSLKRIDDIARDKHNKRVPIASFESDKVVMYNLYTKA